MENALARKVIDTIGQQQFEGDMVLAYLWNSAAAMLGYEDIISRAAPTEDDLRNDIHVVLSRPEYRGNPLLENLLSA